MGMTSDQNENLSFAEQRALKKEEEKRAKEEAAKAALPKHILLGVIELKGKKYQLLVGESDKKWYKAEYIKSKRIDKKNRTPLLNIFSEEIVPLTSEEFDEVFNKVDKKRVSK